MFNKSPLQTTKTHDNAYHPSITTNAKLLTCVHSKKGIKVRSIQVAVVKRILPDVCVTSRNDCLIRMRWEAVGTVPRQGDTLLCKIISLVACSSSQKRYRCNSAAAAPNIPASSESILSFSNDLRKFITFFKGDWCENLPAFHIIIGVIQVAGPGCYKT